MDHISWLSDVYGPRLTGGPGHQTGRRLDAEEVRRVGTRQRPPRDISVRQGLVARALQRASRRTANRAAHRLSRIVDPGHERHRSSPTSPACRSNNEADFQKYRGTLKGKIVLTQPAREVRMLEGPFVLRMTEKDFEEARRPSLRVRAGRRAGAEDAGAAAGGAAPAFSRSCRSSTSLKASSRSSTAAATRDTVRRRQRPVVAAAAARRRHDLPDRQRLARRRCRHRAADGHARGRTLQPPRARPRQGRAR